MLTGVISLTSHGIADVRSCGGMELHNTIRSSGVNMITFESVESGTLCFKVLPFSTICLGSLEWNPYLVFVSQSDGEVLKHVESSRLLLLMLSRERLSMQMLSRERLLILRLRILRWLWLGYNNIHKLIIWHEGQRCLKLRGNMRNNSLCWHMSIMHQARIDHLGRNMIILNP